jgi:hypothetical protein
MVDAAALLGTWRMVSWTRTATASGTVTDALGPDPIGYIAYHADGRMMAFVSARDRIKPNGGTAFTPDEKASLFDSMLAYSASYRIDGDKVVHHVDGSWNPNWGVTDLVRPFTLDGDTLVICGAPGRDPVTDEEVVYRMEFRKV